MQAPDPIIQRLSAGAASAAELEQVTGRSASGVQRRLRELIAADAVIRIGSTRGARYALLRQIEGIGARWPLRQVGPGGSITTLGTLHALAATEFLFEADSRAFAWGGVSEGLPYFLQDQRPGGFLGRAVPQRYPELSLPQRVVDWTDDHYLRYLTQRGSDTLGDLILGDASFNEYLAQQRRRVWIRSTERAVRFPQLAHEVLEGGLPGSSAHGEHPKFATLVEAESGPRHVIVKFSPPVTTTVGLRWSDLLIAEHLSQDVLADAGLPATRSAIHRVDDRTYLEVERFDRLGLEGRVGVTSLLSIDASLFGRLDTWLACAQRLHTARRIGDATLEAVRLTKTFAELIANTDRHFGNLSFIDRYDGQYSLAPIYDMLPMLFAPAHDQVLERTFEPPLPTTQSMSCYPRARSLAQDYWRRCASDTRISDGFRTISATCLQSLEALPNVGVYSVAGPSLAD